ncbi:MAG: hypothetical protein ACJ75H_16565 [Thermoanaerobaculia bacterium]
MSEPLPAAVLEEEPEALGEIEGGFSRRVLGWIVGVVSVSFLASVLLGVFGRELDPGPRPEANAFSYSALGHRAAVEFLRRMGLGVLSRQAPAGGIGPNRPLILAEPDLGWVNDHLGHLDRLRQEAAARKAALVFALPKWEPGPPMKDKPEWLSEVKPMSEGAVRRIVEALGDTGLAGLVFRRVRGGALDCKSPWGGLEVELASSAQLLESSPGLEPVVTCPGGVLIARRIQGEPVLYVIADPDFFNNQGLGRARNAELLYRFLTRRLKATGVVFDETIHGFERSRGLISEALRFPMVLATMQGLVLLGVVLWAGMGRFGKPLPPPVALGAGKEILIDNTAKLLANGGHAADNLLIYFRQTTRAVATYHYVPPDLPESERLARLQRIADARGKRLDLAGLERGIERLPRGRRGDEAAARMARRLHDWRLEMMNGNRKST